MMKKFGFTLAEVLITLAIIGVVAAMTIPTLISNYKKQLVETRLARFYSMMNQAIKLSEVDNGPVYTWEKLNAGYVTDSDGNEDFSQPYVATWFNKYLKPYIKILKVENIAPSVGGSINVYFLDGSAMLFNAWVISFFPVASDLVMEFSEDDNIASATGGIAGINTFAFFFNPWDNTYDNRHAYKKGIIPYSYNWDGTSENLLEHSLYGCNPANNTGSFCTKVIQLNNWKIPSDYPYKF